jgi:hypothetical protein
MPAPSFPPSGEIVLYQTEDGQARVECRFQDETIWLTQALISELFTVTVPTVNEHLKNIFDEQELDPGATIRKLRIVRREGKREVTRDIEHYSLNAILAVGYRVRSPRGTQFRRWATERLGEHLLNLSTWSGEVVRKHDVTVAKNYLKEGEITELNRIVTMWLDFAEDQARRRKQVFLKDWETKLDAFLRFNERKVLANAGSISKAGADEWAEAEYDQFAVRRRQLREGEGEQDTFRLLEDVAKKPRPPRKKRPPGKPDPPA